MVATSIILPFFSLPTTVVKGKTMDLLATENTFLWTGADLEKKLK